jgi:uncharacterized protein YndB with AHSA1/START domain
MNEAVLEDKDVRTLQMTRLFDAPVDLVFSVWIDTANKSKWWGPHGFTTTTHLSDVRPGGSWRFTMHGPDGTDFPNRIDYIEVVRPHRLVYLHGDDSDDTSASFTVTMSFEDQGGKTMLTMASVFASAALREQMVKFGAVEGGKQTLDRLGEFLQGRKA